MIFSGDWFDDITHTFTTSGTYDIILITENDNGCTDSSLTTITVHTTPVADAGTDTLICPGTYAVLDGSASTGGTAFNWSPGGIFNDPSIATPEAIFNNSTWITLEYSSEYCTALDTVFIEVLESLGLEAWPDTAVCINTPVQLNTSYNEMGGLVDILWLDGTYLSSTLEDDPVANTPVSITYTVSATCGTLIDYAEVSIEILGLPGVEIEGLNDFYINDPELFTGVVSPATGTYTYAWEPSEFFACPTCESSMFNPTGSTDVYLTVTDENGCRAMDSMFVEIYARCDGEGITVANTISPNNDGYNDRFSYYSEYLKELYFIRIYDRWGNLMHETRDGSDTWDGSFDGNPVDAGVYIYTLKGLCQDNEEFVKTGNITIIR